MSTATITRKYPTKVSKTEAPSKKSSKKDKASSKKPVLPKSTAKTSKERGDELVQAEGLTFARGRVYLTPDTIEAAVRVRKTGSPEIIRSSGVGRTAAVLLFREESGDVAAQNLIAED